MRFPRLRPGDRLSADLVNRLIDEIERLSNLTATAPLEVVRAAGGMAIRFTGEQGSGDVVLSVTSTSEGDMQDGLYPAVIESCTNADGDPPSFSEGQACWAWGLNGATLSEQQYDGFLQLGVHSDGNPVFAVTTGGESGGVIVQITSSGSYGLWNGYTQTCTNPTSNPATFANDQQCYAYPLRSGPLIQGYYYQGVQISTLNGLPVYAVREFEYGIITITGGGPSPKLWGGNLSIPVTPITNPPTYINYGNVYVFEVQGRPLSGTCLGSFAGVTNISGTLFPTYAVTGGISASISTPFVQAISCNDGALTVTNAVLSLTFENGICTVCDVV